MRILFWNLGRKRRALELSDALVRLYVPDIVSFAESPAETESKMRDLGFVPANADVARQERGLLTFARHTVELSVRERVADRHYQAFEVRRQGCLAINLVVVHLRSPLHDRGGPGREQMRAKRCRHFVEAFERDMTHDRTMVYGDFNMDPFSVGMVSILGLNAVSTRYRARKPRTSEGEEVRTLYNPMWSLLGDRPSPAGSLFVDDDGPAGYFWHMPDQLLVRGKLADDLGELRVLEDIGGQSLVTARARKPNTDISDHLPLLFAFEDSIWEKTTDVC